MILIDIKYFFKNKLVFDIVEVTVCPTSFQNYQNYVQEFSYDNTE